MDSLWAELKRRNVVRVAITYAVVAWLVAQVADFATATFGAPDWVLRIFVIFLLLGLPLAVLLAWAFDVTPDGLSKTGSADDGKVAPRRQTRAVFVAFVLAIAALAAWLQFYGPESLGIRQEMAANGQRAHGDAVESRHFDIAFPEDAPLALIGAAGLGNGKQAFAISPNGKFVVYVGAGADGYQLYLRDLSSHSTTPIVGTVNAFNPFFAPNGMWVGYFSGNQLFKVRVGGGEPVLVSEVTNPVGASWTLDDEIVIAIEEGDHLARVPARGGRPEIIETDRNLIYPTVARGFNKVTMTGHVVDLTTGEVHELPVRSRDIRYINGFLFYVFQDSLMAARYDIDRNVLTSKAVPVVTGLRVEIWGVAQWSVSDDGTLLYKAGRDAAANPVAWVSAAGTEDLGLPVRRRSTMEISPDGSMLAILERGSSTADIWIYDLADGSSTKLTTDGNSYGPIFWSPDSRGVYFSKRNESNFSTALKLLGSQLPAETIIENGSEIEGVSISADGRSIGFQGTNGIGIFDVPGGVETGIPSASVSDWGTAVSPDGRAVAYTSSSSGAYNIFLQPIPATGRFYQVSREGGSEEPRWSADGSKVFYRRNSSIMMVDVTTDPEISIGKPEVFYSGTFENVGGRSYALHPDGDRALVIRSENLSSSVRVVTNWFDHVDRLIREADAE